MNNYAINHVEGTSKESCHHFHPYYEAVFFEEGQRTYVIDNNCYDVHANCVVFIKPNTQHSTVGNSVASRVVFYFTEEFLQRYFTADAMEKLLSCFNTPVKDLKKYHAHFKSTFEEMQDAAEKQNDILFAALLASLLSEVDSIQDVEAPPADNSNDVITKIIVFIQENFDKINNLEDVAKEFYISVSHLSTLFKQKTGVSVKQYIIDARINHACYQLVSSEMSISKIADKCGFASCTHFCNTFHKKMNLSPKQYRKKYCK